MPGYDVTEHFRAAAEGGIGNRKCSVKASDALNVGTVSTNAQVKAEVEKRLRQRHHLRQASESHKSDDIGPAEATGKVAFPQQLL
jgi:hypothetical protein